MAKRVGEYGTSGAVGNVDKPPTPFTVNRENGVLISVLKLAYRKRYINRLPHIPTRLDENRRPCFLAEEWEQISNLLTE